MQQPTTTRRLRIAAALSLALSASVQAAPIFENGAVVDGAGLSVLTAPATTFGFGAQTTANNRVADDFTVPLGTTWNVQSLSLYAYQTGASAFTFTSVTWQIILGDLNAGTVVASGSVAVSDEGLVGYRVTNTTLANTQRPVYQIGLDIPDLDLGGGSYWLTWSIGGSLASGPFVPPTLASQGGNAAQSIAAGPFTTLVEAGSQQRVELPFALNGSVSVPEPTSLALVLAAAAAAVGAARCRKG